MPGFGNRGKSFIRICSKSASNKLSPKYNFVSKFDSKYFGITSSDRILILFVFIFSALGKRKETRN